MHQYAHIRGWGYYVPPRIVTNAELSQRVNTNDEWILSRTGIRERRIAAPTETTTVMAVRAAERALAAADVAAESVELIVVATASPDRVMPSTAATVEAELGARTAAAFDLNAACSGFVHAFTVTSQLVASGAYRNALVIGADAMSHLLDWDDRETCVLFGDGAGALYLEADPRPSGMFGFALGSEGIGGGWLTGPTVGKGYIPYCGSDLKTDAMQMNGRAVYRFASRIVKQAADAALAKTDLTLADIDLIVPHQANVRIIEAAVKQLGVPMEKVYVNLEKYGNTGAASVPIALCEAVAEGRLRPGDKVAIVGFGAGLAWGAGILQWGMPIVAAPLVKTDTVAPVAIDVVETVEIEVIEVVEPAVLPVLVAEDVVIATV